jgi:hypothetical protein
MGCNAWNHRIDCNCGWGGDTGGGGRSGGYPTIRVVDGFAWRSDRRPMHDSFVNPNAHCPVCNAPVYFYQSPFGGRVFFDHLGPPWPKHRCTDNSGFTRPSRPIVVLGPGSAPAATLPPLHARDAWRPMLMEEWARAGEFDRLRLPRGDRIPGKFIYVPTGWTEDRPAVWRWSSSDPGMIEVSCFKLAAEGHLETKVFAVPSWFDDDAEFESWRADRDAPLAAKALNAIGFALSFAWRVEGVNDWYQCYPGVDLALARSFFERAAESDHWAAINNLGVMYLRGLGMDADPVKAFKLFERAAQGLELMPLKHLADCYRNGTGCDPDPDHLAFLDELIALRKEEEKASLA